MKRPGPAVYPSAGRSCRRKGRSIDMMEHVQELKEAYPLIKEMEAGKEVVWMNPGLSDLKTAMEGVSLSMDDIDDAENRWARFAPFIRKMFPETEAAGGLIESPLRTVDRMKDCLNRKWGAGLEGRLMLKMDSNLAVAGSVKARGGIYEILKHSEDLALEHGMITLDDNYEKFSLPQFREFFGKHSIHVGSTGNLGLSIGIISAALGYDVTVHMSMDAKQWKKDLLRQKGVRVMEYASDYSEAVKKGRKLAEEDPMSYFVDDENSVNLFLGYSVAAKRLKAQLGQAGVAVDQEHPLFVHIPCGVGGAPGGVAFGLKQVFGDSVYCFFQEPVQAPCMLLGVMTGLHNDICVQDIGLSGLTAADGLAVGRPSKFVGKTVARMLAGEFTIEDDNLYRFMGDLMDEEGIFIEPSSCASFAGPARLCSSPEGRAFLEHFHLDRSMGNATHIAWATGGSLVREEVRMQYYGKSRELGLENAAKSC